MGYSPWSGGVGHDWVTAYIHTLRVSISSRGDVTNVDLPVISLSSKLSNLLAGDAGILFVKVGAKVPFSTELSASPSDSSASTSGVLGLSSEQRAPLCFSRLPCKRPVLSLGCVLGRLVQPPKLRHNCCLVATLSIFSLQSIWVF